MSRNDMVATLRAEIDRKHREAIQALETLAGYLAETGSQDATPEIPLIRQEQLPDATDNGKSRVDIVMGALAFDKYKTVEEIHKKTGLSEESVRAALYSKFVKDRINKKKVGKKMGFRKKIPKRKASETSARQSAASLVRAAIAKHPGGLTAKEVTSEVADRVKSLGSNTNSIGAALYNMKKRGKLNYDEISGKYRLAEQD